MFIRTIFLRPNIQLCTTQPISEWETSDITDQNSPNLTKHPMNNLQTEDTSATRIINTSSLRTFLQPQHPMYIRVQSR